MKLQQQQKKQTKNIQKSFLNIILGGNQYIF